MTEKEKDDLRLTLEGLLKTLTLEEVRAICFAGLRAWRASVSDPSFAVNALGFRVVPLLASRKGLPPFSPDRTSALGELFAECVELPWENGVVEFLWWLVRAGLAVAVHQEKGFPTTLRLTTRGNEALAGSDDSPLLPGFLDRIKQRCPSLPNGVVALLVDARACIDCTLWRPAVVLMGVAYELAIEEIVGPLATKNFVDPKTPTKEAGERLKRIRDMLRDDQKVKLLGLDRDQRRAAEAAYDFADVLRLRRNSAAHTKPLYDFNHAGETEEFLVSAGRHLPGLWSLAP